MDKVGIIGAGAWGTALATVAHRAGREVRIWARETNVVKAINTVHENTTFLPAVPLAPEIRATADFSEAAKADAIVLATPSQFLRDTCKTLAPHLKLPVPLIICAKGISIDSGALMSEVVEQTLPGHKFAVLSGPTFAAEVAHEQPTAVTLACADAKIGSSLAHGLGTPGFRIYQSADVVGTEVGGAVKNVLAIACGIVHGRGLGDNSRAAIITRGLAEMARLSLAKGGRRETLMGLSGIGDLTLTCNAIQSRNFSLGLALGNGQPLSDILAKRNSVAEGVDTAAAVTALAGKLQVDMPICSAVNAIVNHDADTDATIASLLARPVGMDSPLDQ